MDDLSKTVADNKNHEDTKVNQVDIQIQQLKTQLSAAVAAGDSAAVSNLGGELANLETEPAEPEGHCTNLCELRSKDAT